MNGMKGKTAIVTGAGQGIGRDIALALAARGVDTAVIDVNAAGAEETAALVEQAGAGSLALACDVGDLGQAQECVAKTLAWRKQVHFLVNNAGIARDNLLIRMSEAEWDAVIRVNLTGAFNFTKAIARHMFKMRCGRIVNISSVIGLMGNIGQVNYAASKAGVIGLTKSAAREMAARNVTVNAVAPGFIETAMTDALPEKAREEMLRLIPLGAFGTGRDVANVVLFLLSDMGSYVTGQVLHCDGGMVMS
ncbi:MAG: 3-oxoacyl-[acyl-carrier-protein] reductase [Candidatus Krumholzibacteriota bacterium]|nr:3-oxoacyl-[acyl-carrier-protein] reductase [Candidatus Krumholzibacteriota bacterium]